MSSTYEKVKKWIKRDICPYANFESYIEEVDLDTDGRYRFRIYTDNNKYSISVTDGGYLGCTASIRKPRAGEDWSRGSDLPDGKCNEKTWEAIKNAIIRYELIKLSKPVKPIEDKTVSQRQMRKALEIVKEFKKI